MIYLVLIIIILLIIIFIMWHFNLDKKQNKEIVIKKHEQEFIEKVESTPDISNINDRLLKIRERAASIRKGSKGSE